MLPDSRQPLLPRLSVIIAVRNGAATLQAALDSVFEQTYDQVELVVMDGASTDGTMAILDRNRARIASCTSEPDGGIFDAWNKALAHVTGDWICFLGADDRLHAPDVMEAVAAALAADAGAHRVAFGDLDRYRSDGTVSHRRHRPWTPARRRRFRSGEMIPHPSTFHHRSVFDDYGRFDDRFVIAGDYEFLLRVLLDHDPLYIPVVITDMGAGGVSERPSMRYVMTREVYQARYMHGIVSTPAWRSPRLQGRLSRIWIRQHVTPRVAGLRARAGRTSRGDST